MAIARALAADTDILLADEPTGNLDEKNAALVQEIFSQIAWEMGEVRDRGDALGGICKESGRDASFKGQASGSGTGGVGDGRKSI